MKKYILFFCLLASIGMCYSQNEASDFTGKNNDQPRDPRADLMNFVPNEVLVRFKDDVIIKDGTNMKSAGISSVDQILKANGVSSLEKLFPSEKKLKSARIVKNPQGQDMKIPSLHNIYQISVPQLKSTGSAPVNLFQFIEELKALPEVEYAEPNYIYSVDDLKPVGPILTADDVSKLQNTNLKSATTAVVPNDPLYSQQWYIPAVKADLVWEQTTGDTTQVIAILDTGVDWNHPDLKNKIWRNKQEIPNNGIDDDGNGLIDDIRGWDYINNDNNPTDDNSHGTHVAGIAAAESNNGIGIAGVNWKAKIMPIKVFQSSGRGDAANIAKGIIYAFQKGATVINMSFGSYARSLAMEDALANAYATCVLVAAAGNDMTPIGPYPPFNTAFFPAALSFVLGTQAPDGSFTNFDIDGPVFSDYPELWNYEMKAPGTNILSTIPNGNYRVYQGTSMAAPIVSGVVTLYKSAHSTDSQELMWGNLINTTGTFINIDSAIHVIPTPKLMFVNKTLLDTIVGDDNDGMVDAGETIQLWVTIRNTWGQCDSVMVGLQLGEFEDPTTAQIITPKALIGSTSPYANRTNQSNPFKIHINQNAANDRDILFVVSLWYPNSTDTIRQNIILNSTNGEELTGVMDTTLVLSANKLWLVNSSFRVGRNGILIIKPGTHLILNTTFDNKGRIYGIGKPDSLIHITGTGTITSGSWDGKMNFKYSNFSGMTAPFGGDSLTFINCIIEDLSIQSSIANYFGSVFCGNKMKIENSIIRNSMFGRFFYTNDKPIFFKKNNVINCLENSSMGVSVFTDNVPVSYNNFVKILNYSYQTWGYTGSPTPFFDISHFTSPDNNVISMGKYEYFFRSMYGADVIPLSNIYWGTTNLEKIKSMNYDFWKDPSSPMFNYSPIRTSPSDSAHAVVWKVLVNGKDAQDEKVEPVGLGKQRFDIYFNRPMDKTIAPQVAFGVRYPFSSNAINEEGTWSADGRIFTVYKSVKLFTGDGINRVRVTGAKDLEGWEIPTEDMRFEFLISAAASASLDFMATPGLGKVNLEWNNNDLADGLGFNMYRMEHVNDSVLTKPVLVNKTLITDTLYTDFSVTPNKKYYYYYKILRTNLSETDSSKVVSAIPFTASKGDANGDLTVNVLDITTIVAYLLNNNPQPFIIEAADLNSDGNINVLDIVGVVNLVLGGPKSAVIATTEQVKLYLQNDTLFADAPVAIGGIQFDISGATTVEEIQKLKALDGFESGYSSSEKGLRLIFYSLSGKTISAGNRIPLLRLKKGTGVSTAIFGNKTGTSIPVNYLATGVWNLSDNLNQAVAELGQNFPNPLTSQTTLPIRINEPVDEAVIRIVNVMGQEVDVIRLSNPTVGEHLLNWNSGVNKGFFAYLLEIRRGNQRFICPVKKMVVQ